MKVVRCFCNIHYRIITRTSYVIAVSLVWLLYTVPFVRATYLSTRDQFPLIVDREPKMIDIMRAYIESENKRLDKLTRFQKALQAHSESYAAEDDLVWNPLAIFKITKHLTQDLEDTRKSLMTNNYDGTHSLVLPDEDDLYEVIRNLAHLQAVNNLTVADMMGGHLAPNLTVESRMSLEDCFYIGKKSAEKQEHELAVKWLRECEDKFDEHTQDQAANILITSALFVGDKELSRRAVSKCMRKDHTNRKLHDLAIKLSLNLGNWQHDTEYEQWESFRTCAGDYENETASRMMKCRYNYHNSPFLAIAPLKEEILSLRPKVSVFREAVYDSEIELLKADAYNLFRTATVLKDQEGRTAPDLNYRPSQTAFIDNKQPKYMSLYKRLQDISSLSLNYGEMFQMLHYAPGGFYRVHADYLLPTPDVQRQGNRVATALMYLNSVAVGGSTVFPRQKMMVQPVKGSILFWMNMRPEGTEEFLSRHAACPVIFGEKIACTQWFRIKGQDRWIAEPEDDIESTPFLNPNNMCRKRTNIVKSNPHA